MIRTPIDMALSAAELKALFDEIRRYLEAVDVFRCEGTEPCWRLEGFRTEVPQ